MRTLMRESVLRRRINFVMRNLRNPDMRCKRCHLKGLEIVANGPDGRNWSIPSRIEEAGCSGPCHRLLKDVCDRLAEEINVEWFAKNLVDARKRQLS
ncbi:MAG: hypothetical protein JWR07_5112 [Nevskia sp.]|nr:hypothetical protein [Nevskia sp.]